MSIEHLKKQAKNLQKGLPAFLLQHPDGLAPLAKFQELIAQASGYPTWHAAVQSHRRSADQARALSQQPNHGKSDARASRSAEPESQRALDSLGFTIGQAAALEDAARGSRGLVLLCGTENSGVTTSLQALAHHVEEHAPHASIGRLTGFNDIGQSPEGFMLAGLHSLLRRDLDLCVIDALDGRQEVEAAIDLVLTGRKVFAKLFAYSAFAALSRLQDLGLDLRLLAAPGFINGVIWQRLLPALCQHCSVPYAFAQVDGPLHAALAASSTSSSQVRARGQGCSHCHGAGLSGRVLVAEAITHDTALFELLAAGDIRGAEKLWLSGAGNPGAAEGLPSAFHHALRRVHEGQVAIADVARNFDPPAA